MEIPTLTTKINKLKLKISNEEDEILDIDEQIKLLKLKRKEKLQKVETMKEKINDYRAQRKELKQQSKDEEHHEAIEPVNITSIPSDIMHKYIAKYLLDKNDKRPFISDITSTKIYKTLETKQDLYLNNLLFGKPRLPFIHKNNFNKFTEHNLNENKYFVQYIERLFKLNFDVEVSIKVDVRYFFKQDKNNKLNWAIYIVDLETLSGLGFISDFKISMSYEKHDIIFCSRYRTLKRQCMIKDTKIISIISELENYIIEYKKRYTSFVEDFNVFQDDDSDSEIGF
jgi:hypothetical protein